MLVFIALLTTFLQVDSLHLQTAHRLAEENFPRRVEAGIAESIRDRRIDNLSARFLPELSFSAQATYASHVPEMGLDLPGVSLPNVPRDQYKAAMGVEQLIYDGGLTRVQRRLEEIEALSRVQDVEIAMVELRQLVNSLFFGVVEAQLRLASLQLTEDELSARIREAEAQVEAGAVLDSRRRQLSAQRLSVRQQRAEVEAQRRAALDALSELTGHPLDDAVEFILPPEDGPLPPVAEARRAEQRAFELNRTHLTHSGELIGRRVRPTVAAFAEGAYGRPPGGDFFDDRFRPFVSGGLRLQWQPWQWNVRGREREVTELERRAIDAVEQAFLQRLEVETAQFRRDVERLDEALHLDDEIIREREAIVREAAVRLREGTASPADYLVHLNALHQARLQRDVHVAGQAAARARYLTTLGHDDAR